MPGRRRSSAIYLSSFLALCVANVIIYPADSRQSVAKKTAQTEKAVASPQAFKHADMSLDIFRKARKDKRLYIINAYLVGLRSRRRLICRGILCLRQSTLLYHQG